MTRKEEPQWAHAEEEQFSVVDAFFKTLTMSKRNQNVGTQTYVMPPNILRVCGLTNLA